MLTGEERRRDKRIRFSWPIWFGYSELGELFKGQAIDLSRNGVGFAIDANRCPGVGEHILTRFSYPSNLNGTFEIDSYFHWAEVIRVDNMYPGRCRVAMQLHERLAYDPDEVTPMGYAAQPALS
jgi:hypothetical protein